MLGLGLSVTNPASSGLGSPATVSYLLDDYSGAAAAYSLRKLSSSYSGSAIRVRREDTSTEQDIGFSGNELDTAALATFCSGTNGFVTTWYDQAGSNDATQTTPTSQPKIYDSVTGVITENGKPIIESRTNAFLATVVDDNLKIFSVARIDQTGVFAQWETGATSGNGWLLAAESGSTAGFYDTVELTLNTLTLNGSNYSFATKNRGDIWTDFSGQHVAYMDVTTGRDNFFMGYEHQPNVYPMWSQQELILYPSTSTHSASGIVANINAFYSIYP